MRKQVNGSDTLHKTRMRNTKLMEMIVSVIDLKDPMTAAHCESVARYSVNIGKELQLPGDQLDKLQQAARLHDIGKIMVDNSVLYKKEKLNDREFLQIRGHAEKGMRILTIFHMANYITDAAWHHHERWDGEGYPDGLEGKNIALITRIVSIADALDAMTEDRPYRTHLSDEEIIEQVKRGRGTQFDPELADIVIKLIEEKRLN